MNVRQIVGVPFFSVTHKHTNSNASFRTGTISISFVTCFRYRIAKFPLILLMVIVSSLAMTTAWYSYCGGEQYDSTHYICCGEQIRSKPSYPACCGTTAYNWRVKICCGGQLQYKPIDAACCGTMAYNWHVNICCAGQLQSKPPNPACCGTIAYDWHWDDCCNGQLC